MTPVVPTVAFAAWFLALHYLAGPLAEYWGRRK